MGARHFIVTKCDALRDLIPFVQFKIRGNAHGGMIPNQVPNQVSQMVPNQGVTNIF